MICHSSTAARATTDRQDWRFVIKQLGDGSSPSYLLSVAVAPGANRTDGTVHSSAQQRTAGASSMVGGAGGKGRRSPDAQTFIACGLPIYGMKHPLFARSPGNWRSSAGAHTASFMALVGRDRLRLTGPGRNGSSRLSSPASVPFAFLARQESRPFTVLRCAAAFQVRRASLPA